MYTREELKEEWTVMVLEDYEIFMSQRRKCSIIVSEV